MALFTWNVVLVVIVAFLAGTGGLVADLAGTSEVFDISDVIQFLVHLKSSSISKLIKGKLRDLQNLLETKTSVSNLLLSAGVLPIIFVLYSKDLLVVALLIIYSIIIRIIIFICIITHFIFKIISLYSNSLYISITITICIFYKCVINFWYTWCKWRIILKG